MRRTGVAAVVALALLGASCDDSASSDWAIGDPTPSTASTESAESTESPDDEPEDRPAPEPTDTSPAAIRMMLEAAKTNFASWQSVAFAHDVRLGDRLVERTTGQERVGLGWDIELQYQHPEKPKDVHWYLISTGGSTYLQSAEWHGGWAGCWLEAESGVQLLEHWAFTKPPTVYSLLPLTFRAGKYDKVLDDGIAITGDMDLPTALLLFPVGLFKPLTPYDEVLRGGRARVQIVVHRDRLVRIGFRGESIVEAIRKVGGAVSRGAARVLDDARIDIEYGEGSLTELSPPREDLLMTGREDKNGCSG